MHDMLAEPIEGQPLAAADADGRLMRLSTARPGHKGVIVRVGDHGHHDIHAAELERRLLELGFVEGARVELLHEGLFGRDPIALRIDDMRVALRRHEAASLTLKRDAA
jgi:ferrous iron transport protein A